MKKLKNKKLIIAGGIIGALVVSYFIFNKDKNKDKDKKTVKDGANNTGTGIVPKNKLPQVQGS